MSITSSVDQVAPDLTRLRFLFVNLYFQGTPESWVLIDAGLQGSADDIINVAEELYGEGSVPKAYILTHGHFDHVGAFSGLLERWDVPIYAHPLEIPFLTGQQDYPAPDPSVDKGLMGRLSFAYPHHAYDYGDRVQSLPADGSVPFMPGWRWIHTPGHTEGHVSLFRDEDRTLIAGDAIVTTQQESLYAVMTQKEVVQGPPAYLTPDWTAARASVEAIAALNPQVAATGHGTPMRGEALRDGLAHLVANFDDVAVPTTGKWVPEGGTGADD